MRLLTICLVLLWIPLEGEHQKQVKFLTPVPRPVEHPMERTPHFGASQVLYLNQGLFTHPDPQKDLYEEGFGHSLQAAATKFQKIARAQDGQAYSSLFLWCQPCVPVVAQGYLGLCFRMLPVPMGSHLPGERLYLWVWMTWGQILFGLDPRVISFFRDWLIILALHFNPVRLSVPW